MILGERGLLNRPLLTVLAIGFVAAMMAWGVEYLRQPTKLQHRLQSEQVEMRFHLKTLAEQLSEMEQEVQEIERTLEGIK
jgi:hypothetical protein